jgi:hypothetical protein
MAGPAAAAVAMVLAVLVSASGAAHASAAYELRLANTSAIPFHLLDNPFKGGRALLADPKEQWEEWERIGRYSQIANPQMPGERLHAPPRPAAGGRQPPHGALQLLFDPSGLWEWPVRLASDP